MLEIVDNVKNIKIFVFINFFCIYVITYYKSKICLDMHKVTNISG